MTGAQPVPPECPVRRVEIGITDDLHLAGVSEVGLLFDRVLALEPDEVVVDLSACRHIDAAAIGLLLDVHRRLTRRRAVLTLRDPSPRIRSILQTARVDGVLPIVTSDTTGTTSTPRRPMSAVVSAVHGRARVVAPPLA
ncbi:STAS domain-containing protein [Micromonospora sp. NPDC126480]|uniref:STAS domain-containing protein n=1 Tax=Micromonospora sp. NPDC126480 TaxID=3155312 RepID=UPI00332E2B85